MENAQVEVRDDGADGGGVLWLDIERLVQELGSGWLLWRREVGRDGGVDAARARPRFLAGLKVK